MSFVKLEKRAGYAIATIDRPKQLNALNADVLNDLDAVIEAVKADEEIRALIITGAGEKSFVAGADIAQMKDMSSEEGREFCMLGSRVFRKLELLEIPVIAAVNGYALGGGCELALACDMRFAAENAVFAQPEVGLGIIPGFGGTQRFMRVTNVALAKEYIFTGNRISAEYAYEIGLVNRVLPAAELMTACEAIAERIAKSSRHAIAAAKKAMNPDLPIDEGLELENEQIGRCFGTAEQHDLMTRFVEKSAKK